MSKPMTEDQAVKLLAELDTDTAATVFELAAVIANSEDPAALWGKARGKEPMPNAGTTSEDTDAKGKDTGDDHSFPSNWPVNGPFANK